MQHELQVPGAMTPEQFAQITAATVQAIAGNASRLGLTWGMHLATVHSQTDVTTAVILDGDTAYLAAKSMIGTLSKDDRVYVMQVPPNGLYVVGWANLNNRATPITYVPQLVASTTSPTLGVSSVQNGRYWFDPITRVATVQGRVQFGSSGMSAGSGTYAITLPIPPNRLVNSGLFGNADPVGIGAARDDGTAANSRTLTALLGNSTLISGFPDVVQFAVDGSGSLVNSTTPFTWDVNDRIAFNVSYLTNL